MQYSDLPKAYRALGDKYPTHSGCFDKGYTFLFDTTSEGVDFWRQCTSATDATQLPPIATDISKYLAGWSIDLSSIESIFFENGSIASIHFKL